jgi:nucleoid-associated protein YgaU
MSPEKVAILVVAGLIAVLLAVALLGSETTTASPGAPEKAKSAVEKPRPAPKQIEEYTYQDIVKGSARPRPEAKPAANTTPQKTSEYVVKKNDTIEKISRRELGSPSYVSKILALNKGVNPAKLTIGQKLALPVVRQESRNVTAEAAKKAPARTKKEPVAAAGKSL